MTPDQAFQLVAIEFGRMTTPGQFASDHEAYSVLLEEVEEFWDEVRKKSINRDRECMKDELVQIAAVALRALLSYEPEREAEGESKQKGLGGDV